jgi:superfamily II DNA or RNA helicase
MIRISGLPPEVCARICDALTIANPKYAAAVRFSGWHPRGIEKELYGYRSVPKEPPNGTYTVDIAPGFAAAAWGICQKAELLCELKKPRTPELLEPLTYSGESRPYQDDIVNRFHSRYGVLVAPCGSGKTDMGIRLMLGRRCRFLIIVHTLDLAEQWVERIRARTGEVCGLLRKGKAPDHNARFLISTVQTLVKNPVMVDMLSVTRDGVLVDECHHTPSTTFTKVLARMDPCYRFGITATLERVDGLTNMIHWWIGPVIATLPQETLEVAGHVMRPRLQIHPLRDIDLEHNPEEPGDYTRVLKEIVAHPARFESVFKLLTGPGGVLEGVHLILCWTIEQCEELANRLNNYVNLQTATLHGKVPKKQRKLILDAANLGKLDVIIATTVADEGLDIPHLTAAWILVPLRAAGRVQQRLGRICRPREGKEQPILHDIVDTGIWRWKRDIAYIDGVPSGKVNTKRFTFIEQFRHRFNKVYRKLCDYDEAAVKAVLGK